ncbi:MAG: hypothetical protein U0470_12475 [Anaerolineae bacterium]
MFGMGTVSRVEGRRLTAVWSGARLNHPEGPAYVADMAFKASLAMRRPDEIVVAWRACWFNGAVVADVARSPATTAVLATSDERSLRGPTYPRRIAAGDAIWVMQGGFSDGGSASPPRLDPNTYGFGSVQRWSPDGALEGQHNFCFVNEGVDATVDGQDVYVATRRAVTLSAGPLPPLWRADLYEPVVRAADAGRRAIALIDSAAQEVIVRDRGQRILLRRSYAAPRLAYVPVDVALAGDRVWLADSGAQALVGIGLTGGGVSRIALPDTPRAVADGPDGSLYVLGSRGWVYRYAPGGRAWPPGGCRSRPSCPPAARTGSRRSTCRTSPSGRMGASTCRTASSARRRTRRCSRRASGCSRPASPRDPARPRPGRRRRDRRRRRPRALRCPRSRRRRGSSSWAGR